MENDDPSVPLTWGQVINMLSTGQWDLIIHHGEFRRLTHAFRLTGVDPDLKHEKLYFLFNQERDGSLRPPSSLTPTRASLVYADTSHTPNLKTCTQIRVYIPNAHSAILIQRERSEIQWSN